MKEKPIMFNPDMVRAILDGRKTQTRRIFNMPGSGPFDETWHIDKLCTITSSHPQKGKFGMMIKRPLQKGDERFERNMIPCPQGRVGDLLWVRETHWRIPHCEPPMTECFYHATDKLPTMDNLHSWGLYKKYPSIHMPRWASRIVLRITDIRVERLNMITDADAISEGIFFTDYGRKCFHPKPCPLPGHHASHFQKNGWSSQVTTSDYQCLGTPRMGFANLWNSINGWDGPKSWDANPYVWAIEFEVVK